MEGQPAPGLRSGNGPPGTPDRQVQVEGSRAEKGNTTTGDAIDDPSVLVSQIETELIRRSDLRSRRMDVSSTINAYAVVLVLLASITFALFVQPPGGVNDDGLLNIIVKPERLESPRRFIYYSRASFHLAVTGILVCMGCIVFVIPSEDVYPEGMSMGGASLTATQRRELHSNLKQINDGVSRALRRARTIGSVANLCLGTSVLFSVYAANACLRIVLPKNVHLHVGEGAALGSSIVRHAFTLPFLLYSAAVVLKEVSDIMHEFGVKISFRGFYARIRSFRVKSQDEIP